MSFFSGNAPIFGASAFYCATNATVYYLPGAIGYGSTHGGRPAVLWNPRPQTTAPSFGVRNNRFGFTITGTPNIPFIVEACTNLANAVWQPLQTCTFAHVFA